MAVFLIAQINIHDREKYAEYGNGFMDIFSQYNGKLLAVDEETESLEGKWDYTRSVLIEFPTKDDAMTWYRSEEYQELAKHRFASSEANLALIQG